MEQHGISLEVNFSMSYDWHQVPFEHFKLYTCTQRQIYRFPPLLIQSLERQCLAPSSSDARTLENHPNLVLHQSTSVLLSSIIDLFVYFCRAAHIQHMGVGKVSTQTGRLCQSSEKMNGIFQAGFVYGLRWIRMERLVRNCSLQWNLCDANIGYILSIT